MTKSSQFALMAVASAAVSLFAGAAQAATCAAALGYPSTATCTNITFEKAGLLQSFGGMNASVGANPTIDTQKSAIYVKDPANEGWAGATVYTFNDVKAPYAVNPTIGFSQGTKISMAVYAERAGLPIMAKVENANDGGINKESGSVMTTKAGWQTMVFDFAGVDLTKTYNKLSVFPLFFSPASDFVHPGDTTPTPVTTYIDNISFPTGTVQKPTPPCTAPGKPVMLVGGSFASGYGATASQECGTFGEFSSPNAGRWWGGSQFAGDSNFYFGYGLLPSATAYVGGYVNAPKMGFVVVNTAATATVSKYSSMTIGVWGNGELFNMKPPVKVVLTSRDVPSATVGMPACTPAVYATIDTSTSANPAAPSYYTLNFSSFKVAQACTGYKNVAKILSRGVVAASATVLAPNLYFPNATDPGANGMNIGTIVFN